jgi:hypothetical protein
MCAFVFLFIILNGIGFSLGIPPIKLDLWRKMGLRRSLNAPITSPVQTITDVGIFQQSHMNYRILSDIIENISGIPFTLYIKQRILNVLGMKLTGFNLDESSALRIHFSPAYLYVGDIRFQTLTLFSSLPLHNSDMSI